MVQGVSETYRVERLAEDLGRLAGMDSQGVPAWRGIVTSLGNDPGSPVTVSVTLDGLDGAGVCLHGRMVTRFCVCVLVRWMEFFYRISILYKQGEFRYWGS